MVRAGGTRRSGVILAATLRPATMLWFMIDDVTEAEEAAFVERNEFRSTKRDESQNTHWIRIVCLVVPR